MKCQRCLTGRLFREYDTLVCIACGHEVPDKPVQPLDLPYQGALKPIPPRKVVRRA